jgi:hypothetical protein
MSGYDPYLSLSIVERPATSGVGPKLNKADLDTGLWALLRWMIERVGGEWRVEDLDATGRLYQLAAAGTG